MYFQRSKSSLLPHNAHVRSKSRTLSPRPGSWGCVAERGLGGGNGVPGVPQDHNAGSPGGLQGCRSNHRGCPSLGTPLHGGEDDTQGPTITWGHTRGRLKAPAPCSPFSQPPPPSIPIPRGTGAEAAGTGAYRAAPLRSARRKREETPGQRATGQHPKSPSTHRTPPSRLHEARCRGGSSSPSIPPPGARRLAPTGHPGRGTAASGENPNPAERVNFPILGSVGSPDLSGKPSPLHTAAPMGFSAFSYLLMCSYVRKTCPDKTVPLDILPQTTGFFTQTIPPDYVH